MLFKNNHMKKNLFIIENAERRIARYEKEIKIGMDRLQKNFMQSFKWESEQLYKNNWNKFEDECMIQVIKDMDLEAVHEFVTKRKNNYISMVLRFSVSRSTSALSNEQSLWENECYQVRIGLMESIEYFIESK